MLFFFKSRILFRGQMPEQFDAVHKLPDDREMESEYVPQPFICDANDLQSVNRDFHRRLRCHLVSCHY